MPSLGDLFVTVGAKIDGFEKAMSSVSQQIAAADREARRAADGFKVIGENMVKLGGSMAAAVTLPLAGIGTAVVTVAGQMEQTTIAFTTLLGSADAARKMLEQLKQFAASTPFEFTELADAARKMMALGFSAQDVIPILQTVGNAASALGRGAEGVNQITFALGQMQNAGRVSAQDMNQLTSAGIKAWQYLAEAAGVSIAEIRDKSEKGLLNGAAAVQVILAGMQKDFGGAMEAQSKTLLGQWSNFKDQVTFTLMDLGTVLLPVAKDLLAAFTPLIAGVKEFVQWFVALPEPVKNTSLAIVGLVAAVGPLLVVGGTLISSIGSISSALTGFSSFVIPAAGKALLSLSGSLAGLPKALQAVSTAALNMFVGMPGQTSLAVTALGNFKTALAAIPGLLATASASVISFFANFGSSIAALAASLKALIAAQLTAFVGAIGNIAFAVSNNMVAALTVGEKALLAMGYAAAYAGAIFVGWKLGQWAYDNIPGLKSLGDAMSDLIMKVPGVTKAIELLSGASGKQKSASEDLEFATKQLEDRLKAKGVVIDKTGLSTDEYAKKLREAVKSLTSAGKAVGDVEAAAKGQKKQLDLMTESAKLSAKAKKEMEKAEKDAAEAVAKQTAEARKQDPAWKAIEIEVGKVIKKKNELVESIAKIMVSMRNQTEEGRKLDEMLDKITSQTEDWRTSLLRMEEVAPEVFGTMKAELDKAGASVRDIEGAYKTLGVTSSAQLKASADAAKAAYETIKTSGIASARDVLAAEKAALDEKLAYMKSLGSDLSKEDAARLKALEAQLSTSHEKQKGMWGDFTKQVSTIVTDFSKSLVESLFDGDKSWAEKGKKALVDLGQAAVRMFVEPFAKAVSEFLAGALSDLLSGKGLKGVLDRVNDLIDGIKKLTGAFRDMGDASSAAIDQVNTGGGGGGGGAGAGSAAASGGIAGIVNMITGIVSAISNVIANFQLSETNKTLDTVGKHTLETAMAARAIWDRIDSFAADFMSFNWNQVYPSLRDIYDLIDGKTAALADFLGVKLNALIERMDYGNIAQGIDRAVLAMERIADRVAPVNEDGSAAAQKFQLFIDGREVAVSVVGYLEDSGRSR